MAWLQMCGAYVRSCNVCAQRQSARKPRKAPLQTIDILGPFTESSEGNKKVLVFADYFTKWLECIPLKDEKATVAKALVSVVISRFGVPGEIHSDRERDFISSTFREVCSLLGISKTYTTPRHPQSDGMVERHMKVVVGVIKSYLDPLAHQRDWDQYLPYVSMAYRSSVHASTGESPNFF
uniref:Gypsy retrotransposon integrase-like protein 1-like n=1 Tax=Saccoglossus kowalevskii TaxID=10224 RepID=A0ABM0M036_SACKO|nr:PREDICTED: gypsy retrotransposon integrase-like protein 1-like [Saccoglossus kowalevskii]